MSYPIHTQPSTTASAWGNAWHTGITGASANSNVPRGTLDVPSLSKSPAIPRAGSAVSWNSTPGSQTAGKPLRKRDLVMIITQLSIMSRSGVDLADAVQSIAGRAKRPDVKQALSEVHSALQEGQSFSQALQQRGHLFGEAMVAVIRAGEASGRMTEVLCRLSVLLRDEMRLQATIRSVMSYPALLLIVTFGVLAAMILFVLPQFAEVYKTMEAPTPWFTQILLEVGTNVRTYWWAGLLVTTGVVTGGLFFWRSKQGKRLRDRLVLRAFMLGPIFKSLLAGRALRLVGNMLESGVPLIEALQLASNATGNSILKQVFLQIEEEVLAGRKISTVLISNPYIPEGTGEMVATAEVTGQLANVMQTVGEFHESEGEQLLRDGVKILEPIIIVGLGIVVAGVVLAVMLPLLDLSTSHK
jgi:type IV pilus assembly protein PilC